MILAIMIRAKTFLNLFILLSLVNGACGQKKTKKSEISNSQQIVFSPGKGYKNVKCEPDTAYSYALYLPGIYNESRKSPVMFFFDAHKRGGLPVGKYKDLAEKYGFILAGSNNSVNGQRPEEMDKCISVMMDDATRRFQADGARIYTGGFSGGARVAAYTALFRRKVAGVAGCAAGFPQIRKQPDTGFVYIGFVGDEDFNYLEMKELDKALEQAGFRHLLVVYAGEHDWPPPEVMENAFLYFQFDAMRRRVLPADSLMIKNFKRETDDLIKGAEAGKDPSDRAFALRRAIVFLSGVADVGKYGEALDKLMQSGSYKKIQENELEREKTEQQEQQAFAGAMGNPARIPWLMQEIERVYNTSVRGRDTYIRKMNKRLLNYLSLLSYLYAKEAFKANDLAAAGTYLNIYEKVDADNPEVYVLKAVRLARLGQDQKAVEALREAAHYGFGDVERLKKSKDFIALHGNKSFGEVLKYVKSNQGKETIF